MKKFVVATVAIVFSMIGFGHAAVTSQDNSQIKPPKVYLDKSPRIVAYQLKRLDNQRLLMVERKTDDPKYLPVFNAILTRAGMSPQYREEALDGLVILNKSNPIAEILNAVEKLKTDNRQGEQTAQQLAKMLVGQSNETLTKYSTSLIAGLESEKPILKSMVYAALNTSGNLEMAIKQAGSDNGEILAWLSSVALIPEEKMRNSVRPVIVGFLKNTESKEIKVAAIRAMKFVTSKPAENFQLIASFVRQNESQNVAIQTLLKVPAQFRDKQISQKLVAYLVDEAEKTPAAKRTADPFIDSMQLVDQLLVTVPVDSAKKYRARLREITVRVVRIQAIEEEMRYDIPYFAVEAGRPVQVVLKNEDLMAHNLVITQPESLKEVADLGLAVGPNNGFQGKPYVPESDKVMFATGAVQSHQQGRLTFTAPTEVGEYPYVCTFPQHWSRMYGVMIVVEDLDAWSKNPTKPKDPIGSNRSFVQKWKVSDLSAELENGLRGRSFEIGKKTYQEATCAQCHKLGDEGGAVGPALDEVFSRWKGDRESILREILEPSHRIDEKYSMHRVVTIDGLTYTGIIKSQNDSELELLENPESKETRKVPMDDIDELVKTSQSIMPKALLDQFTKDEIFELFAFLEASQKEKKQ